MTGTVKGQMVDAAGVGVSGITVALSDTSKGLTRTVTTNADGRFQLQLRPGVFTLRSSASGYTSVNIGQVVVNIGKAIELTIPVEQEIDEIPLVGSGESHELVTVRANAVVGARALVTMPL